MPNVANVSGLSILACPFGFLWIVHSCLPLWFSLDCPFLLAPLVFSNVYVFKMSQDSLTLNVRAKVFFYIILANVVELASNFASNL
jgi:hypothetical protein